MKYDIHFRHGGTITVESKRTLNEISDLFTSQNRPKVWGVLADGDEPTALISVIDVVAVVPAPVTPAKVVADREGDIWKETEPGSGIFILPARSRGGDIATLAEIKDQYGPVKFLTSNGPAA